MLPVDPNPVKKPGLSPASSDLYLSTGCPGGHSKVTKQGNALKMFASPEGKA
jgi:hypothetical protein